MKGTASKTLIASAAMAVLTAACSSQGDYFRVDRLIDHEESVDTNTNQQAAGAKGAQTAGGAGGCARADDCDEYIPPIKLSTFIVPDAETGVSRPIFAAAQSCEKRLAVHVAESAAAMESLQPIIDNLIAEGTDRAAEWNALPSDSPMRGEVSTTLRSVVASWQAIKLELTSVAKPPAPTVLPPLPVKPAAESPESQARVSSQLSVAAFNQMTNLVGITKSELDRLVLQAEKADAVAADKARAAAFQARHAQLVALNSQLASAAGVFDGAPQRCMKLRNDLMSALITRSDAICERHKGQIHALATTSNLGLGLLTTVFAGAGAITAGGGGQIASAGAASTNSARSQINEQIYQQQYVGVVTRAIDSLRNRRKAMLEEQRKRNSAEYGVAQAVRDVQEYHFQCSFYSGMQELSDAITERQAKSVEQARSRLAAIKEELKAAEAAPGAKVDIGQQAYIQALQAERLKILFAQ